MRRERWPTREERERIRERIAEAGSVRAWIRAGKPHPDEVLARKRKLNALAEKCGMARLYLTQRNHHELYELQGKRCCVDGCEETEGLIGEHSTPEKWRHAKPDQLMCVSHHRIKTRSDIKKIWKVKRLNGEAPSQYERTKKFGSKLRGRGFGWDRP